MLLAEDSETFGDVRSGGAVVEFQSLEKPLHSSGPQLTFFKPAALVRIDHSRPISLSASFMNWLTSLKRR
jgi:hypothetical protein